MATTQQPSDGSLPSTNTDTATKTTAFRATDRPEIDPHAVERWQERVLDVIEDIDVPVDVAWRDAVPINFGTFNSTFVRYHVESDRLLLAQRTHTGREAVTILKTVLEREWREDKHHVRRAVAAIRRERGLR